MRSAATESASRNPQRSAGLGEHRCQSAVRAIDVEPETELAADRSQFRQRVNCACADGASRADLQERLVARLDIEGFPGDIGPYPRAIALGISLTSESAGKQPVQFEALFFARSRVVDRSEGSKTISILEFPYAVFTVVGR